VRLGEGRCMRSVAAAVVHLDVVGFGAGDRRERSTAIACTEKVTAL